MKYAPQLIGIACLTMTSQLANAYNFVSRSCGTIQGYNNGHMEFNLTNTITNAEDVEILRAFARLTDFSDTSIIVTDNNDSDFGVDNGENEIFHDTTHATAQCNLQWNNSTCVMEEVDIRFGNQTWVTGEDSQHLPYLGTAAGGGRNILGTAIHEGAHCIGMGHENIKYNIMGDERDHVTRNGTNTYYGPGEDLSDGLIDRYGKATSNDALRDLGVTVMRFDVASGEYSSHKFGVLRNASGTALSPVGSFQGQDIFEVVAGETVQMELTFENNGEKNLEAPHVGFYLSSNSIISSSDTLLKTDNGYSLGRNSPYEVVESVTIPAGTAPGDYYLGAYVNHDFVIGETTFANNVAYYPIEVLPPPSDLIVPFAGVNDSTLLPTQAFSILAITRNQGPGPSDATTLRYYRSTNSLISTSDSLVGSDAIPVLASGAQMSSNDPETAPSAEGTYWYGACVVAVPRETATNNQCSSATQVTVAAQLPAVTTGAATNIGLTDATIHASVIPNGATTTLYFDWGTDNQFNNTLTVGNVGSGITAFNVSRLLGGLLCNTTYQVRARAVNSKGTRLGNVQEFTTEICPGCN